MSQAPLLKPLMHLSVVCVSLVVEVAAFQCITSSLSLGGFGHHGTYEQGTLKELPQVPLAPVAARVQRLQK